MVEESLKNKTVKGTMWSAADAFLGQGVTFLVGIVLARMLSPDEYGLIGICIIFNTVLNGITDSGFSNALIRKKDCTNDDYNTMFLTNMVISVVLYMCLFFASPLISSFFGRDELTQLLRVTGIVLFFNGLSLTHTTILTKWVDFKTKTKASIISAFFSGVIGVAMAYMGLGAWALVGQMVSKQVLYTFCLWFLIHWCPTLKFNSDSFRYMWGFGWKMLLSGLLNNIWNQLYQVVVGKYYSPATLGQYTRSRQFAAIFSENMTNVVQRVSYPILSKIQDEQIRMLTAYRKVIKITMYVTVLALFLLGSISKPLIYTLLGDKWALAAEFLPLICISMSLYPLHSINLNMLQIFGRSDLFLYLEIIKKILAFLPLAIGVFIGVYAMLVASIITGVISFFLNSWYTGKKLGYSSWMQLRDVAPSYAIGLLLFIIGYCISLLDFTPPISLLILCISETAFVIIYSEAFHVEEYDELKKIIREFVIK